MVFQRHTWPFFAIALCAIFIACGDDNSSGASANLKNTPIADSTIQKTADVLKDWGFKPVIEASDIDVFQNDGIILFMEESGENLRRFSTSLSRRSKKAKSRNLALMKASNEF